MKTSALCLQLLVILLVTLAGPFASAAEPGQCSDAFVVSAPKYGSLRQDFVHNATYSNELKNQSDVRNQGSIGVCTEESWISVLEQNHLDGEREPFLISHHYLMSQYWLARSLELLDNLPSRVRKKEKVAIKFAAGNLESLEAIKRFGIIPDQAWTGRRNFQLGRTPMRINEIIRNIVARAHVAYERNPQNLEAIVADARKAILDVFENLVGSPPDRFEFRGQTYTPHSFMNALFPELKKPMILMQVNRQPGAGPTVTTNNVRTEVRTDIETLEATVRSQIDAGHNVYVAYAHNASYVDPDRGVMALDLYHYPEAGRPLERHLRDRYGLESGGHAVVIVGYDLDPATQKVVKWKIKNSGGKRAGDRGYNHMYDNYFRTFVKSIAFFDDHPVPKP